MEKSEGTVTEGQSWESNGFEQRTGDKNLDTMPKRRVTASGEMNRMSVATDRAPVKKLCFTLNSLIVNNKVNNGNLFQPFWKYNPQENRNGMFQRFVKFSLSKSRMQGTLCRYFEISKLY